MAGVLDGLKCKIWVDDVFFFADTEDELLDTLDAILGRLEGVGLFAAAHKCTFFARELVWCGKVYSHGRLSHDPVRLQGLSDMRRPETAAELMEFFACRQLAANFAAANGGNSSSFACFSRRTDGGGCAADESWCKKPRYHARIVDGG